MASLVKNELIKLSHKKGLYIWFIITIVIFVLEALAYKVFSNDQIDTDMNVTVTKEELEDYDILNDPDGYVNNRVTYEINELEKNYDKESTIYYYIANDVYEVLNNAYTAKYINSDEEEYNLYMMEYEEMVNNLDSYDWHDKAKNEKASLEDQIEELNNEIRAGNDNLDSQLKVLNHSLEAVNYRLEKNIGYAYSDASSLIDYYENAANLYDRYEKDESLIVKHSTLVDKRKAEEEYNLYKYQIENEIYEYKPYATSQWLLVYKFNDVSFVIFIAMVIVLGGIIAEEFNKGTIKQLLVRPHSRIKILLSKMIAGVIAILIFSVCYNLASIVYSLFLYHDINSFSLPILVYDFNKRAVVEYSTFKYCLVSFLAVLPEYIIVFLFTIFLGCATLNSALTTVGGLVLPLVSLIFGDLFSEKLQAILPISCWDFSSFLFGGINENQYITFDKSIIVCVITIVILITLSLIIFKRRDIKNQ